MLFRHILVEFQLSNEVIFSRFWKISCFFNFLELFFGSFFSLNSLLFSLKREKKLHSSYKKLTFSSKNIHLDSKKTIKKRDRHNSDHAHKYYTLYIGKTNLFRKIKILLPDKMTIRK